MVLYTAPRSCLLAACTASTILASYQAFLAYTTKLLTGLLEGISTLPRAHSSPYANCFGTGRSGLLRIKHSLSGLLNLWLATGPRGLMGGRACWDTACNRV